MTNNKEIKTCDPREMAKSDEVIKMARTIEVLTKELCDRGEKTGVGIMSLMVAAANVSQKSIMNGSREIFLEVSGIAYDLVQERVQKSGGALLAAFLQDLAGGKTKNETACGFKLPSFQDLVSELDEIHHKNHDEVPVTLEMWPSGQWNVAVKSSQSARQPTCYYGEGQVPGRFDKFNSRELAIKLVDQAHEACHGKDVH